MLFKHQLHPHQPTNINDIHKKEQSGANQRIAVIITKAFGTMQAFYILVAWMFLWMILASIVFWLFANDKYPFPFLLFCSNLIQLWALPVLAVGQNVLSRKAELQAEEQFNTTVKIYHDIEQIALHQQEQDKELLKQTQMLTELTGKNPT